MRRDYAGVADLEAIQRFAQRIWSLSSRWHIGDLAWSLGQVPEGRPDWPMALWTLGGDVVAWGWLTLPDNLALLVDPAHPELVDDVLAWATSRAARPLQITVLDTETALTEALVRHAYTAHYAGPFFLAHSRDLADLPPTPEPPTGFTVRPMRGAADLARRAGVHREVWHPSTVTDEKFRTLTRRWPYHPDFDMVVEAPDGTFVAYCMGWYDAVNRVGELEPVGTVAEFRRLGLSRAASLAVLRAFRDAGGETAIVFSRGDDEYPIPKQVYAALGFAPQARTVIYHR